MQLEDRLARVRVFVEIGRVPEAETALAGVLAEYPDDRDALSLFAKVKHIKGELSHAIATWARLQPVRATGELEPALEQHKAAMLDLALQAERAGDLRAARAHLESLGRERGLEQDRDRLFALARVYEELGTRDALEGAARICRHVLGELARAGTERLTLIGRLARIERRLGRDESADELDERFVAAMRRRMHRPSLHDLVRVAAREYIPLTSLRAARLADRELSATLSMREQGIAAALRDDFVAARARLADVGEPIDRLYLAELASLSGNEARAVALVLGAGEPLPSTILGWLLDRRERHPAIATFFGDRDRRDRTRLQLERDLAVAPLRPETWRHLAALHWLAGAPEEAHRCSTRATAVAIRARERAQPIGRVLAAGVYHFGARAKGLLHEVWVGREPCAPGRGGTLAPEDIHGNVTTELRAAVRSTFLAVRAYARAKFPGATRDLDDYVYSYKLPKDDEPSGGVSAGLPSALAFLSTFLQRPIPCTIASSGMLVTEAHDVISIGKIGEADYKVKAAFHGNLDSLILPIGNRADLEDSAIVPAAITAEVVRYVADLDDAVKLVFGSDAFIELGDIDDRAIRSGAFIASDAHQVV